jgi:thiol-disulfide isomerase/thioredoxin
MNKKTIITTLLALVAMVGLAKEKVIVWEQPTTEYGTSYGNGIYTLSLVVTKVELKDSETVVYITANRLIETVERDGYWFRFAGDTYLKVGNQRYPIVKADGIELDKQTYTDKDGKLDMAFHFQPLPLNTKSFDFIEGDGDRAFLFKGIKPVEERWKQLLPSYWSDEKGDWKIAFLEDCAIHDCKFWTYQQRDVNPKTGEAKITMRNGNDELKVTVGKDKKGKRTIQIGGQKADYTMITSRFLADYPIKDTRTKFVNSGFKPDTITVVGWLKDMPDKLKSLNTYEFEHRNFLIDEDEYVYADLDSLGRFSVKIPVLNSTEFYCDTRRSCFYPMLESGKTYFVLYDFKEGRRYIMGDDTRLQNELLKYTLYMDALRLYEGRESEGKTTPETFDRYIVSVDSLLNVQYNRIDSFCEAHPTLSTRYNLYQKGRMLSSQAGAFGQARFTTSNLMLPDNARKYIHDTFWTKLEEPYTLHNSLNTFLRDYLQDEERRRNFSINLPFADHLNEIASNEEELTLLKHWLDWLADAQAKINAAPTIEEKQKIANEVNTQNADMLKKVDQIINSPKTMKLMEGKLLIARLNDGRQMLDSLQASPSIMDLYLSRMVYEEVDNRHSSLSPAVLDTLKAMTNNPSFIETIEKVNNKYLAIESREFDKLVLKSSNNLADLSEGEALLKKIIEPYKGKFVLLDIWGTWCGPCKEALSHSTEEYARLKDYDIEFLYLANGSPQASWENVIKEYNVSGPNVAHYNLPDGQQAAIEHHLDVHSWPTYKLFNRNGDMLDLNVDARDLDGLARLLEQMK